MRSSKGSLSLSSSAFGPEMSSGVNKRPSPLIFHSRHGDHVQISEDGTQARRFRSYCKGECHATRFSEITSRKCREGKVLGWNAWIQQSIQN